MEDANARVRGWQEDAELLKVGAKLFDHGKNTLALDTAKKLIRGAIVRLEDYGFDVANLQGVCEEIRSFAGLG